MSPIDLHHSAAISHLYCLSPSRKSHCTDRGNDGDLEATSWRGRATEVVKWYNTLCLAGLSPPFCKFSFFFQFHAESIQKAWVCRSEITLGGWMEHGNSGVCIAMDFLLYLNLHTIDNFDLFSMHKFRFITQGGVSLSPAN